MRVRLDGIVMETSEPQLEKAQLPMDVKPDGSVMETSASQYENEYKEIVVPT